MEWYLWVLIGYFGIGFLFSLVGTVLMFARYIFSHKYTKLEKLFYLTIAIVIWPYIIYIIFKKEE